MTRVHELTLGGALAAFLVGSALAAPAWPPEQRAALDWNILRSALIWIDGAPLLPPYTVEIVGDSAVVVNSHPVHRFRGRPAPEIPPTPKELLIGRANAAMGAALRRGVPDSLIAAVGCSVLTVADTSLFYHAEVLPSGRLVAWSRFHGRPHAEFIGPPHRQLPDTTRDHPPTRTEQLESLKKQINTLLSWGSLQLFSTHGPGEMTCPRVRADQLYQDIIEAASAGTIDKAAWLAAKPAHLLHYPMAVKVAQHTTWSGR